MILPATEEQLERWFESYTSFVVQWAAIAEREGVEILGIGSEMNALSSTLPLDRWGNARSWYGFWAYQQRLRRRGRRWADEIAAHRVWAPGREAYDTLEAFLEARYRHNMAWARQAHLRPGRGTLRRVNERRRTLQSHWLRLIGEARRTFHGKLTYAANFDNYRNVGFWSHLDLLGINGYFSLSSTAREVPPTERRRERFRARWRRILGDIQRFQDEQGLGGMRYLFTELGYTFRRHSTVEPWNHAGFTVVGWKGHARRLVVWNEQPVDYGERCAALEALRDAARESGDRLIGILYWKLSTDAAHEAIEPFVLHVGRESIDPALAALLGFAGGSAGD
jgi:hypothetical protein